MMKGLLVGAAISSVTLFGHIASAQVRAQEGDDPSIREDFVYLVARVLASNVSADTLGCDDDSKNADVKAVLAARKNKLFATAANKKDAKTLLGKWFESGALTLLFKDAAAEAVDTVCNPPDSSDPGDGES